MSKRLSQYLGLLVLSITISVGYGGDCGAPGADTDTGSSGDAPSVTTGSATNITHNSATLNGTVTPHKLAVEAYFEYGTTSSYGSRTNYQGITGKDNINVSATIANLSSNTDYYYRLVVRHYDKENKMVITCGNMQTFKTRGQPIVATGAATNVSYTTATLNGTVNPNGLATDACFEWSTTLDYGNTTATQSIGSGNSNVSISASLTGLNPGTTYYFRVIATNSAGTTTPFWERESFTTLSYPPAQVASPSPANGATNIPVSTIPGWAAAVYAASYDVYFGTTNPPPYRGNTTVINYNMEALNYSTTYYWRVDSKNTVGTTQGAVWSFQTEPIPVPAQALSPNPANSATNIPITIALSWGSAAYAASYDIYFGTTTTGWTPITNIVLTFFSPSVLSYSTTYYWRIDPKNASGTTSGTVWGFQTETPPPSPPAQVTSPNPVDGATSVVTTTQLSWAAANGATSYDVYFGTTNPPSYVTNQASTTYNPGALLYLTAYYWRIDSKNSAGTTNGNTWSFQTCGNAPLVTANPATNITSGSSILNGIVNSNGLSTSVYFEWGLDANYGNTTSLQNIGNGIIPINITATLTSLTPKTTYNFRLVATNSFATTRSQNQVFITLPDWIEKIIPLSPRSDHSMIWDGNRVVMFGGYNGAFKDDLWWYDPITNTWTQKIIVSATGSPQKRYSPEMIWDGTRVIMFGGKGDNNYYNDLWWYDPVTNTWTQKIASGTAGSPSARFWHSMVWDGQRVIMFGGHDGTNFKNDLWWYDPTTNTWTEKIANGTAGSPLARRGHSMVWNNTKVIMFGGTDLAWLIKNDVWWYDPNTNAWTEKIANGTAGSPTGRFGHQMVWNGQRIIMFGGANDTSFKNDLWWYEPVDNTWAQKKANGDTGSPSQRYLHKMAWDGTRVVMFAGKGSGSYYNDSWWYDSNTNTWTLKIEHKIITPPGRRSPLMVWTDTKAVMFGGLGSSIWYDDLWWYDPTTNTWTEKIAKNTAGSPSGRLEHQMVWDGTRVIMFGGYYPRNDLWWYDPTTNTWTEKIANGTAGSPSGRQGHQMVWDGTKVIMFGGQGESYIRKNDLWWYDPTNNTWTEKTPNPSPSVRSLHQMVWDGAKVIMFGGTDVASPYKNDLWWYDPNTNTWNEKIVNGTVGSPPARFSFQMVWDGSKVIMFGGSGHNDLWWYDPSVNSWDQKISDETPGSPYRRIAHSMIWNGINAIMYGGYYSDAAACMEDLWWYQP